MKKALAKFTLYILGWKAINNIEQLGIKKFVVVGAPHTSNWDGVFAIASVLAWGLNFKFLIKKDLFFFPLGTLLKSLGGLPVDRKKSTSLTKQAASYFNQSDQLVIGITPEGTRSYNTKWKKGFYFIAEEANVPIVLGYIDYKNKLVVMDKVFERTGNVDEDLIAIKAYYKNCNPKHPEKFGI